MSARSMRSKHSASRGWLATVAVLAAAALVPSTALTASTEADLSISKSDSADPIAVGDELTYTLTVANGGPKKAKDVQVVDELANELDFVSASASQGSCDLQGKTITCALGFLDSGATATVTIVVVPNKDGQISNTATVTSSNIDPQPANNSDTEVTTVTAATTPPLGGPPLGGPPPGGPPPGGPTCAGKHATLVGTQGDDNIVATDKRDVIAALAGNDKVAGLGGKDIICGGAGNDTIKGRGDDDVLKGNAGDDRLRGGAGGDLLRGGGGFDRLRGGHGADALRGGAGPDKCRGGAGPDTKRSC